MKKKATGLISVPMSNVPGAEDVEVNSMRDEDIEAANHGGFNQMEVGDFAKDLEFVKKKMKKKASFFKLANFFDDAANQQILEDIIEDFNSGKAGFDGKIGSSEHKITQPNFITTKKFDPTFDPNTWMKREFREIAKGVDFESGPGSTKDNSRAPNIVRGWMELFTGGMATPDQYESAMQTEFDYTFNLDDDIFNGLAAVANALVGYRELKARYEDAVSKDPTQSVVQATSQAANPASTGAAATTSPAATGSSSNITFPVNTELEDVGGSYSYKVLGPQEIEITKLDGTTVNVTPANAAQNNVNWNLMVSNLSDASKVVKRSANFNFNITKVSNNMKKELIKLNSTLNGLGYNNLIKVAGKHTITATNYLGLDESLDLEIRPPNAAESESDYKQKVLDDVKSQNSEYTLNDNALTSAINSEWELFKSTSSSPTATAKKNPATGRSGPIYKTNNWDDYVRKGDPRGEIKTKWEKINANANGTFKEGDKSYNKEYTQYRQWWVDHGSNLDPYGVIREFDKIIAAQAAAGASGVEEIGDATLISYLTTPLTDAAVPERKKIFDAIKADTNNSSNLKVVGGGKFYLDPIFAARLVTTKYKTFILAAYNKDTQTNLFLEASLGGAPTDTGTTSSTSGAQQPQLSGKVANIASISGVDYYQLPAGNYNLFVRKGRPFGDENAILMQDTRKGKVSGPRPIGNSPRVREYFTVREIARLKEMVSASEGPDMAQAYEDVLRGKRMDESGWAKFWSSKKKEEEVAQRAETAKGKFSTSSRQSRLDNLKKKGII